VIEVTAMNVLTKRRKPCLDKEWLSLLIVLTPLLTVSTPVSTVVDSQPAHLQLADVQTCPSANPQPETSNPELANLQQAAYYYNRYHKLAPDDLLGLKRLTEICTALEQAGVEDPSCQEATERVIRNSQFAGGTGRSQATGHRWSMVAFRGCGLEPPLKRRSTR